MAVAEQGRKLIETLAEMERDARGTTEAKYLLHRAKKETLILHDEDPELKENP